MTATNDKTPSDKARTKLRAALSLTAPTEIEDILNEVAIHEDVLSADIRALKKNCDGLVKAACAEMDKLAAGSDFGAITDAKAKFAAFPPVRITLGGIRYGLFV